MWLLQTKVLPFKKSVGLLFKINLHFLATANQTCLKFIDGRTYQLTGGHPQKENPTKTKQRQTHIDFY